MDETVLQWTYTHKFNSNWHSMFKGKSKISFPLQMGCCKIPGGKLISILLVYILHSSGNLSLLPSNCPYHLAQLFSGNRKREENHWRCSFETKHVGLLQLAASDYSPLARVHKETSGAAHLVHWFPYKDVFSRKMAWKPLAKDCLDLLPLLVPSSDCSIPSFFRGLSAPFLLKTSSQERLSNTFFMLWYNWLTAISGKHQASPVLEKYAF